MLDLKLARDLWQMKGQVITIALVVASGISAFAACLSTYESLRSMQSSYYDRARFAHVFAAVKRVPNSITPRLLDIEGVDDIVTTLSYDVLLDLPEVLEPLTGRMIALPEHGLPRMNRLTLVAGRWVDAPESNQVLVSETFANARSLKPGGHVTALLNGKRERLEIVGIVLSPEYIVSISPGVGDEKSFGVFWIGRKRLAAAFNMEGAFNHAALRLTPDASERAVVGALDRLLERYGSTGAHGRDDQVSHRALSQEINEQRVFGIVLPSVFLGVAMFLLNVVLTRQIGTQRGQIAALKALGCPDWRIGLHYLEFVLVIVVLGSLIGIIAGAWLGRLLTELFTNYFHFPSLDYRMHPWIPLVATGVSLTAAVAGALQALLAVVRLPPAEAMRPASPPTFRATLMERIGLGHLYSPAVRMIVRDMERRPARALFTTLGIAGAAAILISGTWWRDAIDYMLDIELRMRERQDVTVVLAEPVSTTALHDLAQLPGVMRAEIERTATVRLHNGHRSYRTTLSGLPPDSQMRLLLDAKLQTLPLPRSGVVLNDRLAERMRLRVGETVRVAFLQGARLERDVPIVGVVEESMDMRAYMDRDALSRLLGEGDSLSGARLMLDKSERTAFLRRAKETPRLAFVVEIEPIIRNFRETSARNILVFTTILSVLAGTIAVGVVYNNARIALAERAWELASLRVLGLTRAEVSRLLLGELAIELAAALPLGWLFGYWLSYGIVQLIEPETFKIPFIIELRTYAYASLVVLAAGVVSALIVRRRIDRFDLVGVLKSRD
ncbi:MAG: ABC transporter permease [Burkholderiales bacterium]